MYLIYFPEELPLNTHPSIEKALPECYHAELLIKYIFFLDKSKNQICKRKKKKKKKGKKDNRAIQHSSGQLYPLFIPQVHW
jgi:hypothetical protein